MFMPFSKGSRACIGKGLAIMELKLVVATVMKQYDVSIAPDMKDDDMDMVDHFLIIPKGGKCHLLFHKRVAGDN
jgi:cytochrome P450